MAIASKKRKLNLQAHPVHRRNYRHNANEAIKQRGNRQGEKTTKKKAGLGGREGTRHTPQSGGDAVLREKTETQEDYFKRVQAGRLY